MRLCALRLADRLSDRDLWLRSERMQRSGEKAGAPGGESERVGGDGPAPVALLLFWAPSCALKPLRWWSHLPVVAGILTHGDDTARLCWSPASRVDVEQNVG
jgi:hypothetical protein